MLSLNTMIEDGSVEEVAEKLMIMHEECLEGNYSSIERLRQAGPRTGGPQHVRKAIEDDDEEDEDEDNDNIGDNRSNMMMDAQQFQSRSNEVSMQVDEPSFQEAQVENGWTTVVSSRRNRG